MPNLINTDSAGNVFYNYITPVVKGETLAPTSIYWDTFLSTAWGAGTFAGTWYTGARLNNEVYIIRPPAPGLETKTGTVSTQASTYRILLRPNGFYFSLATGSAGNSTVYTFGNGAAETANTANAVSFSVANQYSWCKSVFSDNSLSTCTSFSYYGWCREPVYTGSVAPMGCVVLLSLGGQSTYVRPNSVGGTSVVSLSSAADIITSLPIVCTTSTDPGDGSETATDIVIRDAAAPNHPVGKLWNCIDLPADSVIGGLYRNAGSYDADASASEQDIYLCVMPWGQRKLGMRVWTENVN